MLTDTVRSTIGQKVINHAQLAGAQRRGPGFDSRSKYVFPSPSPANAPVLEKRCFEPFSRHTVLQFFFWPVPRVLFCCSHVLIEGCIAFACSFCLDWGLQMVFGQKEVIFLPIWAGGVLA